MTDVSVDGQTHSVDLSGYTGPALSFADADTSAERTLLIRLARKVAFHDAVKAGEDIQPKVGDLVVETSSWQKIPDPDSIGFLVAKDTDDCDSEIFWIEPLFAPSGTPPTSWGNAMFLPISAKYWEDLGLREATDA